MKERFVPIDVVKKCLDQSYGEGNLLGLDIVLNNVPAIEIIRCGKCIHRYSGKYGMMCIGRPNDFFCGFGESKNGNQYRLFE